MYVYDFVVPEGENVQIVASSFVEAVSCLIMYSPNIEIISSSRYDASQLFPELAEKSNVVYVDFRSKRLPKVLPPTPDFDGDNAS